MHLKSMIPEFPERDGQTIVESRQNGDIQIRPDASKINTRQSGGGGTFDDVLKVPGRTDQRGNRKIKRAEISHGMPW